jgi:transcriptional regulator with XRE-family HTH domain
VFDQRQLAALMRLRRWNASQLAARAGLDRHTVSRIVAGTIGPAGVKLDTAAMLAAALDVPVSDLDDSPKPPRAWTTFSWLHAARVSALFEELHDSQSCLTVTQGMDVFLQPADMRTWTFRRAHEAIGRSSDWIDKAIERISRSATPAARHPAERCIHRVIGRQEFFLRSFIANPTWADATQQLFRRLDGNALVGLVNKPAWGDVAKTVRQLINEFVGPFSDWDKVTIADNTLAVIRPTRDSYLVTYHRPTVERLRWQLEQLAPFVDHSFPLDFDIEARKASINHACRGLESLGRQALRYKKGSLQERADTEFWRRLALGS